MVWPWGSSAPKSSGSLEDLDPTLKDFLKKQRPEGHEASPDSARQETSTRETARQQEHRQVQAVEGQPKQNPHGERYAYLWKTYVPPDQALESPKSDQERIDGMIQGYKHRQAAIGRTALENCALEQWQINDCFKNGPWSDIMMMCRNQTQRLDRCYTMQTVGWPHNHV